MFFEMSGLLTRETYTLGLIENYLFFFLNFQSKFVEDNMQKVLYMYIIYCDTMAQIK